MTNYLKETKGPRLFHSISLRQLPAFFGDAGINGYWIRRSSRFCGQTIRFGLWRNDQVLRLFRREGGRFTDDLVHERVICAEPMGQLPGTLYHDSVDSIEDAREKTFRYARAGAIQLRAWSSYVQRRQNPPWQ